MALFRIIIEVTGDAPVIDARDAESAAGAFLEDVTGDELLQLLSISAERY